MTPADLVILMPRCPQEWALSLLSTMEQWQINTPRRQAAFLAQLAVENAGMSQLTESLNYSPDGLLSQFGTRITETEARCYGRTDAHPADQVAIANTVYANRFGNGAFVSGDGWKYRGRIMGLTFRDNYIAAGLGVRQPLDTDPDLCLKPVIGSAVACWFFTSRGCNALADADQFDEITHRVTGGQTGRDLRTYYYHRVLAL